MRFSFRPRFGLKALLLFMAFVALATSHVGRYLERRERVLTAVAKLQSLKYLVAVEDPWHACLPFCIANCRVREITSDYHTDDTDSIGPIVPYPEDLEVLETSGLLEQGDETLLHWPELTNLRRLKVTLISSAMLRKFANARGMEEFETWGIELAEGTQLKWPRLRKLVYSGSERAYQEGLFRRLIAQLPSIEELDLSRSKLNDQNLAAIAKLPRLKKLVLGLEMWGRGLKDLSRCSELKELEAPKGMFHQLALFNDQSIAVLAPLKKLEVLHVEAERLTDAAIESIVQCQSLRKLHLKSKHVTGKGLQRLSALPHLESLLLDCELTDDDGAHFPRLEWLHLSAAPLPSAPNRTGKAFPSLQGLTLWGSTNADSFLKSHSGPCFPRLEILNLDGTDLSDAAGESLSTFTSLTQLNVSGTKLTPAIVPYLRPLAKIKSFYWDRKDHTFAELAAKAEQPELWNGPRLQYVSCGFGRGGDPEENKRQWEERAAKERAEEVRRLDLIDKTWVKEN